MSEAKKGEFRTLEGVKRSGELYDINPHIIIIEEGFNARDFGLSENQEHVAQLAKSIAEVGLQKPLEVRYADGKIYLTDGESRLRATLMAIEQGAPIETVKATRQDTKLSEADRVLGLITHNSGKPLSIIEQADVYSRLLKFGWNETKIAKAVGLTPGHINGVLKYHTAPEKVKAMVRSGDVSATLAIETMRKHGDSASEVLTSAKAEATAAGSKKVTKKHVVKDQKKKSTKDKPIMWQREIVRTAYDFIATIATDPVYGKANSGIRKKAKSVLENAGIDPNDWFEKDSK